MLLFVAYTFWLSASPWASKLVPPDMVFPDNSRYYGEQVDGLAHGKGEWLGADGSRYAGQFHQGLFEGDGELWGADGNHYKGQFAKGLMSGQGVFTVDNGQVFEGLFEQGDIVQGVHRDGEGNQYTGRFKHWYYQGEGEYLSADSRSYKGTFEKGRLHGQGQASDDLGNHYEGMFDNWQYHGAGKLTDATGSLYVGQFEYGLYHGDGILTLAGEINGVRELQGQWHYGSLENDPRYAADREKGALVESALYSQSSLLDASLRKLGEQRPGEIDLFYIGLAGYGKQDVFRKEIDTIRPLLSQPHLAGDRIIELVNNPQSIHEVPMATTTSLKKALHAVAEKMDREQDILFLYLTSHGSSEHELSIEMNGLALNDIRPEILQALLKESGIKWKIITISACYSGGFIPSLQENTALIMTAARDDRTSFGCSDESDMTYFGRAYFNHALPDAENFIEAFYHAKEMINAWEVQDFPDEERSEPQIFVGSEIEQYLKRWRDQGKNL